MNAVLSLHVASARAGSTDTRDSGGLAHVATAQDFRRWLADEGDNLIAAVRLLGGPEWAERAAEVVASARNGSPLMARRRTLVALSQLLHGSHASELESFEAWAFTLLHPDDPRAANAMRCADALECGLHAMNALRRAEHATAFNEDSRGMG